MKNKFTIILFLLVSYTISAQYAYIYEIVSKDKNVVAKHYMAGGVGIDSVIVKNKKSKLKFSDYNPILNVKFKKYNYFSEHDDYKAPYEEFLVENAITISQIKKLTDDIYLLVGVGISNRNVETTLRLIFIEKDKILKYYMAYSNNKRLRDVTFELLENKEEAIISFSNRYMRDKFIHDIDIHKQKIDTISSLKGKADDRFIQYKLKIK